MAVGERQVLNLPHRSLGENIDMSTELKQSLSFHQSIPTATKKENSSTVQIQIDRIEISLRLWLVFCLETGHKSHP